MSQVGAGMAVIPVFALQEALIVGMQVLAADRHALDELVGRGDMSGTDRWKQEHKNALLHVLDENSDDCVEILPGLPVLNGQARLPRISLVEDAGGDNSAELVMGDVRHVRYDYNGPNDEVWATTQLAKGQQTTVQVGIWDPAPERGALLHAACHWALLQQSTRLAELGIHEHRVSTGGAKVPYETQPRIAWCPMVLVSISWTLRQSHRKKVPNRITLLPPTVST